MTDQIQNMQPGGQAASSLGEEFDVNAFNRQVSLIQNKFHERRVKVSFRHVQKLARIVVEGSLHGGTMVRLSRKGADDVVVWLQTAYQLMVDAREHGRSLAEWTAYEVDWEASSVRWFEHAVDALTVQANGLRPNLFGLTTERRAVIADKLKVLEQRVRPIH